MQAPDPILPPSDWSGVALVALFVALAVAAVVDLLRRGRPGWAAAVVVLLPFAPLAALVGWFAVAKGTRRARPSAG